ncbi:MAG TPA: CAP domain-containing protein [Gaiellaceae bacterium]|nr:CAP domain-containing protein [Gaiellaceae bacterium]
MSRLTARLAGGAVLAAAILATLATAVATPPARAVVGTCTPDASWPVNRPDLANAVVSLVNSHRTGMGLVALQISPTLTASAVWKARHMAEYQYMQHDDPAPPIARTVSERLAACGYPIGSVGWGENIAYGYQTAQSVVTAWLNSPGHRANIENSTYRATGVGAAAASNGLVYWAQDFGTYVDGSDGTPSGSAPTVALTGGPASTTTSTGASFTWTTSGTVTSTTCSLDSGAAVACSSPKSYSGLAAGTHTFRVNVSNASGSSGASYTWTITSSTPSGSAPTVTLTSTPASSTSTSASFAWSTAGAVTSTACSLDGAVASACTSPKSYTGLAVGTHTFRVTVSNAYGSNSASYSWSVLSSSGGTGSGSLAVTITQAPPATTASNTSTFAWTTMGSVTGATCKLDASPPTSCSSPKSYWVAAGTHTFTVTVTGSGGASASATYKWTIT